MRNEPMLCYNTRQDITPSFTSTTFYVHLLLTYIMGAHYITLMIFITFTNVTLHVSNGGQGEDKVELYTNMHTCIFQNSVYIHHIISPPLTHVIPQYTRHFTYWNPSSLQHLPSKNHPHHPNSSTLVILLQHSPSNNNPNTCYYMNGTPPPPGGKMAKVMTTSGVQGSSIPSHVFLVAKLFGHPNIRPCCATYSTPIPIYSHLHSQPQHHLLIYQPC